MAPQTVRELGPEVAATGAVLVDTPVSGSVPSVASGSILVMAGGEQVDVDRAAPALESFAQRIILLGPLGAGATMKLAVNAMVFGLNQTLAESLVLAEKAGVDRELAYEVIANSAVAAPFVGYKRDAYERPGSVPVAFALALVAKDLDLAADLAVDAGAQVPQLHVNRRVVGDALGAGLGDADLSALAGFLRTPPRTDHSSQGLRRGRMRHGVGARGQDWAPAPRSIGPPAAAPALNAAEVLLVYLSTQVAELHAQHARLRADDSGAVHKLRVAARRLRSALKTYAHLLASPEAGAVGDELRWLGHTLGEARDAQVLRERWRLLLVDEPAELRAGPAIARVDDDLGVSERAGREQAVRALDGERFVRLMEALDELVGQRAFTRDADVPALEVFRDLLDGEATRLRRAVDEIANAENPEERDIALHDVRKKAKRLRYAAEAASPGLGEDARALAAIAAHIQRALGEHQDSVMSQQRLREYAARAQARGESGFPYGRMHDLERERADAAERDFHAAWKDMPTEDLGKRARDVGIPERATQATVTSRQV